MRFFIFFVLFCLSLNVQVRADYELDCDITKHGPQIISLLDFAPKCLGNAQSKFVEPSFGAAPADALDSNKSICNCLSRGSLIGPSFNAIRNDSSTTTFIPTTDQLLSHADELRNMIKLARQGSIFQISSLADGDQEFLEYYLQGTDGTRPVSTAIDGYFKENDSVFSDPQVSPLKDEMRSLLLDRKNVDTALLDRNLRTDKQCVSFNEFLTARQIPTDNEFYTSLAEMTYYKKEDWNYSVLRNTLAELSFNEDNGQNLKKIKIIKSRMSFLMANPIVKDVFSLSAEAMGGSLQAETDLKTTKQTLLNNLMTSLNVGAKASQICALPKANPNCSELVNARGGAKKFRNDLKLAALHGPYAAAFADENTKQAVSDLSLRIRRIGKEGIATLNAITSSKKLKELGCDKDDLNVSECVEAWGGYCGAIDQKEGLMHEKFHQELTNAYNPDLEKNSEFKSFVDKRCNTPLKPIKNKNGPALIYADYEKQFCQSGLKTADLCAEDGSGREKLVARYHSEYTSGNQMEDRRQDVITETSQSKGIPQSTINHYKQYRAAPADRQYSAGSSNAPIQSVTTGTPSSLATPAQSQRSAESVNRSPAATAEGYVPQSNSTSSFNTSGSSAVSLTQPQFPAQVQHRLNDLSRQTESISNTLTEKSEQRDVVLRSNPDDARISQFDEEIRFLRSRISSSKNSYDSKLEQALIDMKENQNNRAASVNNSVVDLSSKENGISNRRNSSIGQTGDNSSRSLSDTQSIQIPIGGKSSTPSLYPSSGTAASLNGSRGGINGALNSSDMGGSAQLIVSGNRSDGGRVNLPVEVPIPALQSALSGDVEAISSYANQKLSEMKTNAERVYLQINAVGDRGKVLDLVAVKQADGNYRFFTPSQLQASQNRTPAAQQRSFLRDLQHITGNSDLQRAK